MKLNRIKLELNKYKNANKMPVMKIGRSKRFIICMWVLMICSIIFGIYKNFTAVNVHTVHEKKVVKQEIVDTNVVENFVKDFARDYYTWENKKESIEKRINVVNEYLTEELQHLNANMVRMDIPNSSIVQEVKIWSVDSTGKNEFNVVFSVEQMIKEGKKETMHESFYTVTVHQDTESRMVIVKNPTISREIKKSDYQPEPEGSDSNIDSQITDEITEFLDTFFKLYPAASEKELSYYVQNGALNPIERDNYVFSDMGNITFNQKDEKILVSVTVNYLDKQTKAAQISQFDLTLEKDKNWMIVGSER